MNEYQQYLPFVMVVLVLAIVAFVYLRKGKQNFELLTQVSRRRGGTVKRGFLLSLPTLVFQYKSQDISVHSTPGSRNSPPRTALSTTLRESGRAFKMHIYRENALLKALELVGLQDIKVGNDAFDSAFVVQGSDDSSVKDILTPVIQERLLGLNRKGIDLLLKKNSLRLVVNYIPGTEYEFDPLIDAFTAILEVVLGGNY